MIMPKFPGMAIQTGHDIRVSFAIAIKEMKRLGVSEDEIDKFLKSIKDVDSFEKGCDLIREWFPLDIDLLILNNCKYNNCTYPGCPKTCEGRHHLKVKRRNGHHHKAAKSE